MQMASDTAQQAESEAFFHHPKWDNKRAEELNCKTKRAL